jgi:hypothetical protein
MNGYFVFYQDWMIRPGYGGTTYGFIIAIRKKYLGDRGLLEHEKVHVDQFWRTFCLFPIIYLLSKTWRLKWEVEAYREQLKWYEDDRTERFADFIATKYGISVTAHEAATLLKTSG